MSLDDQTAILRPGETCWRIERAERFSVIVDAARYFAVLRSVIRKAQHSVIMIGWEFDTRISLDPLAEDDTPERLGKFLSWAVRQRPDLKIYLLEWDTGVLRALGRGSTPLRIADWISERRIKLKLDHAHPAGAAHHQKIVVIDDALAFCGGIDATADRWDTRDHEDENPLRKRPTTGRYYKPWHDATVAVDGDAARALGQLARERWKRATGDDISAPPRTRSLWPEDLTPTVSEVDVAISRTAPPYGERAAVHEIEALYLAIIAGTRRTLYIESQYFASRKLAEAIAARLREPAGPEFVIINPVTADGWLEEEVMGSSRARLLAMIGDADIYGRFRLYTPVAQGGTPIYVHAKIVVMDDRLLRIGSSNLNNRSLGYDTECDLSIEAQPDDPEEGALRQRIGALRTDLLAEHLGVSESAVDMAVAKAGGSLIGAIEALCGEGRTLAPFEPPELNATEDEVLGESDLLDPERPRHRWRPFRLSRLLPGGAK
ncbi:phospholipase D-like domain-containing protein [Palleronia sp.]|uniref:phospholipase D-like domain-containing protein n=1 Tax=Palleronia sp. TaxID=1940284 RepID=UPI0035C7EB1F